MSEPKRRCLRRGANTVPNAVFCARDTHRASAGLWSYAAHREHTHTWGAVFLLGALAYARPASAESAEEEPAPDTMAVPVPEPVPVPETPEPIAPHIGRGFAALDRPTGMAEAGMGWLTLPGAEVCVERSTASCRNGDTSFELEAWQLYRNNLRFAFGAGLLLGLIPTTDTPPRDPEGIVRDHSRRYLTLEGTIRHYPYVGEKFEFWWGVTGGLVVVSDRFSRSGQNDDKALLGPRSATIRTEGGSIGLAAGGMFWLSPHWSSGLVFRYGNWFLPRVPAVDVLRDEASLTGRNTMFSLGLVMAYRIVL